MMLNNNGSVVGGCMPAPTPKHRLVIEGAEAQSEFILGGKAIFTIENTARETRLTFRVEAVKGETDKFDVRIFTGSDNHLKTSYTFIGTFEGGVFKPTRGIVDLLPDLKTWADDKKDNYIQKFVKNMMRYYDNGWKLSEKQTKFLAKQLKKAGLAPAVIPSDDFRSKSFAWLMKTLACGELPDAIVFYHEGMCCKCARRLTVPASILVGMGPDCAARFEKGDLWKALNKSFPAKVPAGATLKTA